VAHIPVLLKETIALLNPQPNENFIDGTFGGGGHSAVLLEKTAPNGIVIGLDWDTQSLANYLAHHRLSPRLILENRNFANLSESPAVKNLSIINGILFDLGISSWHLEESAKGFAFSRNEPLDMRYDLQNPLTAAQLVNNASLSELEKIISEYGQERYAASIAQAIATARTVKLIETTNQLTAIIAKKLPLAHRNASLARVFQALRIAVNHELENIEQGISHSFELLSPQGRLAVITFHSLEDRLVKTKFQELVKSSRADFINKKPLVPSQNEINQNPRARSAKLRVIKKNF